jgi:hypothetical protein
LTTAESYAEAATQEQAHDTSTPKQQENYKTQLKPQKVTIPF